MGNSLRLDGAEVLSKVSIHQLQHNLQLFFMSGKALLDAIKMSFKLMTHRFVWYDS